MTWGGFVFVTAPTSVSCERAAGSQLRCAQQMQRGTVHGLCLMPGCNECARFPIGDDEVDAQLDFYEDLVKAGKVFFASKRYCEQITNRGFATRYHCHVHHYQGQSLRSLRHGGWSRREEVMPRPTAPVYYASPATPVSLCNATLSATPVSLCIRSSWETPQLVKPPPAAQAAESRSTAPPTETRQDAEFEPSGGSLASGVWRRTAIRGASRHALEPSDAPWLHPSAFPHATSHHVSTKQRLAVFPQGHYAP